MFVFRGISGFTPTAISLIRIFLQKVATTHTVIFGPSFNILNAGFLPLIDLFF